MRLVLGKSYALRKMLEFVEEDVGLGDITTESIVDDGVEVEAVIVTRDEGVVAGLAEVRALLEYFGVELEPIKRDGDEVGYDEVVARLRGSAKAVLTLERTVLNILMRMSGVATETRKLVELVRRNGFSVRIAATRKTAPGLRYFDKRAVEVGGADTHRLSLYDAVLIKNNHVAIAGSVAEAVKRAREKVSFIKKVEVEVSTAEEAVEAAKAGADVVMFDNMSVEEAKRAMDMLKREGLRDKVLVEISGSINYENVLRYASLEPDVISVGYITHSLKALNMSLKVVNVFKRSSG